MKCKDRVSTGSSSTGSARPLKVFEQDANKKYAVRTFYYLKTNRIQ